MGNADVSYVHRYYVCIYHVLDTIPHFLPQALHNVSHDCVHTVAKKD
jgi:hypothetical protein